MRLEFEGWSNLRKFAVALEFEGDTLVYASITVKRYSARNFHRIDIDCQSLYDEDDLVTECFDKVLDLASSLLQYADKVEVRKCKNLLTCTEIMVVKREGSQDE